MLQRQMERLDVKRRTDTISLPKEIKTASETQKMGSDCHRFEQKQDANDWAMHTNAKEAVALFMHRPVT